MWETTERSFSGIGPVTVQSQNGEILTKIGDNISKAWDFGTESFTINLIS